MKRYLAFLIVLFVVFVLIGCNSNQSEKENQYTAGTLEQAEQLILDGNYRAVLESIEQIIEQDPANDDAYTLKAAVYLMAINQAKDDLNCMIAEDIKMVQDPVAYRQRITELFEDHGLTLMLSFEEPADEPVADEPFERETETDIFGNTATNLRGIVWPLGGDDRNQTQGNFAFQGDNLYFTDYTENNAIYKIGVDGSHKKRISGDSASFINVIGEWVYYVCANEENRVFKVKTDGNERTQLTEDAAGFLYVLDKTVYYINQYDNNAIYCVPAEGGEPSFFAEPAKSIFADESHLYYSTADERNLIRINLADMAVEYLLNDEWHIHTGIYEGWLYYVGEGNPLTIKRINLSSSEREDVWAYDSKINNFTITDHHLIVHVRDKDTREFVIRFDLDTMEQTERVENAGEALCVDGMDNVYFQIPEGLFRFDWGAQNFEQVN